MNIKSGLKHFDFIKKKPMVSFRIANGFFRRIVLRKDVLRTVDLAVTYNCHWQCQYCSACLLKKENKPVLTVSQIKNIWQEAYDLGAIHINLTGGEPLMRDIDELCEIVKNLSPEKTLISLVTNSISADKEKLIKLKKAGLDTLQLSIESLDAEKNDRIRGVKGALSKTMEAFNWAKELGFNICLSSVICRDNIKDIEELLRFAERENVFLLLNTASSVGRWQKREDKKIIEEDIAVFNKLIKNKHVRNDTSFNFSFKRGCPGGKERMHITAYGDVLTCPLVQVSYGNALKEPLRDIFKRMNSLELIKKHNKLCKHSFDKEYYEKICKPSEEIENPPLDYRKIYLEERENS